MHRNEATPVQHGPLLLWAGRRPSPVTITGRARQQEYVRQLRHAIATLRRQPGLTAEQRQRGILALRRALQKAQAASR